MPVTSTPLLPWRYLLPVAGAHALLLALPALGGSAAQPLLTSHSFSARMVSLSTNAAKPAAPPPPAKAPVKAVQQAAPTPTPTRSRPTPAAVVTSSAIAAVPTAPAAPAAPAANTPATTSSPSSSATASTASNAASGDEQPARFDAAYLNNPKPPYPMTSRRRGETGRVLLRVAVSATGQPTQIEIVRSSGYALLDQAAQQTVGHWRFVPARRGSTPVDSHVRVPIDFSLEDNS